MTKRNNRARDRDLKYEKQGFDGYTGEIIGDPVPLPLHTESVGSQVNPDAVKAIGAEL